MSECQKVHFVTLRFTYVFLQSNHKKKKKIKKETVNQEAFHCPTKVCLFQFNVSNKTFSHVHYENLPMQCTEIFSPIKIENFIGFLKIVFLFLLKT